MSGPDDFLPFPVFYHVAPTDPPVSERTYPTQDMPMRHAWVVVGTETLFLCHQIMGFMQGHNYEMVVEVALSGDTRERLLENRAATGATHFLATGAGEKDAHTLPAMKAGHVPRFQARIWDFFPAEWGAEWPWTTEPKFDDVTVEVKRIVHYRHLDFNLIGRRFESYFLFGKGEEAHLCHSVVAQPDYDHVATLEAAPEWLGPHQLEAGVFISVPELHGYRSGTRCSNPLPGGRHRVLYQGIEEYRDLGDPDPLARIPVPEYHVDVERTWWFSTRVVNFFPENPCPRLIEIPDPQ